MNISVLFSRVHFTREPISALLDLLAKPLCFFRGYRSVGFLFFFTAAFYKK